MRKFFSTYLLQIPTLLFTMALPIVLYFSGCSKDDETNKTSKANIEKLGEMTYETKTFFSFNGNPVVCAMCFIYQWNPDLKNWEKIGNDLWFNSSSLYFFAEDDLGNCYAMQNNDCFNINMFTKTTGKWTSITPVSNAPSIKYNGLFGNGKGDIVCFYIDSRDGSKVHYLKKVAGQSDWVEFAVLDNGNYQPYYLTDNGYLYFTLAKDDDGYDKGLSNKVLDIKTGEEKKLWDETDPDNMVFGKGLGYSINIRTDGSIYCFKWDIYSGVEVLYKLDVSTIPAKFKKVQTYTISIDYEEGPLHIRPEGFSVDVNGNMKFAFMSEKPYVATYYGYATANTQSSDFNVIEKKLSNSRYLITNRKNETFIQETSLNFTRQLYQWK